MLLARGTLHSALSAPSVRVEPMSFPRCEGCKAPLQATARICPKCGALTGISMSSSDEPIGFGWYAFIGAIVISCLYLLLMDWYAS